MKALTKWRWRRGWYFFQWLLTLTRRNVFSGPVPNSDFFLRVTVRQLYFLRYFIDPLGWPCSICGEEIQPGESLLYAEDEFEGPEFIHERCFVNQVKEARERDGEKKTNG